MSDDIAPDALDTADDQDGTHQPTLNVEVGLLGPGDYALNMKTNDFQVLVGILGMLADVFPGVRDALDQLNEPLDLD